MFERILGKSERMLKFFVKIQCFFAFVAAVLVFGAAFNLLGMTRISALAALIIAVVAAVVVWFSMMSSAWIVYAFADLVEYTKASHDEISEMSAGLAEYTKANHKEIRQINTGLTEYTKAMNKVLNSMGKNLYLVARHCCAEESHGQTENKTEKRG